MSEFVFLWHRPGVGFRKRLANARSDFMLKAGEIAVNPEQIKDEIRKLNWIDKIGIYRWINQEVAGYCAIGTDRSLQIRQEIERIFKVSGLERRPSQKPIEQAEQPPTGKKSGSDFVGKN